MRNVDIHPILGNRFFDGESDREAASRQQYNSLKGLTGQIQGLNSNVNNRFNNYTQPFDYRSKASSLDKYFNTMSNDINRTASEDSAMAGRGTAARLASQGITGGSILNNQIAGAQNQVNKNKFNSLSQLKASRLGLEPGLMESENQNKLAITDRATNVDMQNLMNTLRKYGMVQQNYGLQGQAIQGLSDGTVLDDIFAGAGMILNPVSSFIGTEEGAKWLKNLF